MLLTDHAVEHIDQFGCRTGFHHFSRVLAQGHGRAPKVFGVAAALREPDTAVRLFGKPEINGQRRMAVTLARGLDLFSAREKARRAAAALRFELDEPVATPVAVERSQLIL